MSYPFGGHPQFGHVKAWVTQNGGSYKDCVTDAATKLTIFTLENGTKVPIANLLDKDYVSPTVIATIERRLEMPKDWFKPINRPS